MMNHEHYQRLEVGTKAILECLDSVLSAAEKAEVLHFFEVGEYGVALETLCGVLVDEGYAVPRDIVGKIAELGAAMRVDPRFWQEIKTDAGS